MDLLTYMGVLAAPGLWRAGGRRDGQEGRLNAGSQHCVSKEWQPQFDCQPGRDKKPEGFS